MIEDSNDDAEVAEAGPVGEGARDSERRRELVTRLIEYSAANGLSGMSLRPLAAAVGSSPRVLLYFFGSKEGLVREILGHARVNQLELVERSLAEQDLDRKPIEVLWEWLTDPGHAEIEKLFFESYARSLHDKDGAFREFGAASVADWLPPLAQLLSDQPPERATLVLAAIRGLLLDLLATGDRERVQRAFADLLRLVS